MSFDFSNKDCPCNSSSLTPSDTHLSRETEHDIEFSIDLVFGETTIARVAEFQKNMVLRTEVQHEWEKPYLDESIFDSAEESASRMTELDMGSLLSMGIPSGDFSVIEITQSFSAVSPGPGPLVSRHLSSWSGAYTENTKRLTSELVFVDPAHDIFVIDTTERRTDISANSTQPMGWTHVCTSDDCSDTQMRWVDAVGFSDVAVNTDKVTRRILVTEGRTNEYHAESDKYTLSYDLPEHLFPYQVYRDWYNLAAYGELPGDGKGDGVMWVVPLWLFGEDGAEKYKFSFLDDLIGSNLGTSKSAGFSYPYTGKEFIDAYSLIAPIPRCCGSYCLSRVLDGGVRYQFVSDVYISSLTLVGNENNLIHVLAKEYSEWEQTQDNTRTFQKGYPVSPV